MKVSKKYKIKFNLIAKGDYIKLKKEWTLKEDKEFLEVTSIYIDTKELGSPEIIELENGYKIRMTSYAIHPDKLIEEIKKGNQQKRFYLKRREKNEKFNRIAN